MNPNLLLTLLRRRAHYSLMRVQPDQLARIFGIVPSINRVHGDFLAFLHADGIVLYLRACGERRIENLLDSVLAFELGRRGSVFFGCFDRLEVSFSPGDGFWVGGLAEEGFVVGVGKLEEPVEDPAGCDQSETNQRMFAVSLVRMLKVLLTMDISQLRSLIP